MSRQSCLRAATGVLLVCLCIASPSDVQLSCESPSLPRGAFHIVIAAHEAKTCFMQYLWHLGLSNAKVFVYRRVDPERPTATWQGPCGIEIEERLLLPNGGYEAAAFHSYVLEHYHSPPAAMMFLHGHGPHAYHTSCDTIVGRARLFYRGLSASSVDNSSDTAQFAQHMVSLTKLGGGGDKPWLQLFTEQHLRTHRHRRLHAHDGQRPETPHARDSYQPDEVRLQDSQQPGKLHAHDSDQLDRLRMPDAHQPDQLHLRDSGRSDLQLQLNAGLDKPLVQDLDMETQRSNDAEQQEQHMLSEQRLNGGAEQQGQLTQALFGEGREAQAWSHEQWPDSSAQRAQQDRQLYEYVSMSEQQKEEQKQLAARRCQPIFERWGANTDFSGFYTCCASFILPWGKILTLPRGFYQDMLRLAQTDSNDVHPLFTAIACFEYSVYGWYRAPALSPGMKRSYLAAAAEAQRHNLSSCSGTTPPAC